MPVSAPTMEAKPAARPWLSVRLTNSVMSGPGRDRQDDRGDGELDQNVPYRE